MNIKFEKKNNKNLLTPECNQVFHSFIAVVGCTFININMSFVFKPMLISHNVICTKTNKIICEYHYVYKNCAFICKSQHRRKITLLIIRLYTYVLNEIIHISNQHIKSKRKVKCDWKMLMWFYWWDAIICADWWDDEMNKEKML